MKIPLQAALAEDSRQFLSASLEGGEAASMTMMGCHMNSAEMCCFFPTIADWIGLDRIGFVRQFWMIV